MKDDLDNEIEFEQLNYNANNKLIKENGEINRF